VNWRSENIQLTIRIILISGNALGFAWLTLLGIPFYWSLGAAMILIAQVILVLRHQDRLQKRIAMFFRSVKNEAYGIRFDEDFPDGSIKEIHRQMNRINELLQEQKKHLVQQERYYQDLLELVSTGILTIDQRGFIILANSAAKSLLGMKVLSHIEQLEKVEIKLYNHLKSRTPRERILVKLHGNEGAKDISVITREISLRDEKLFMVILQDIRKELDHKEMESWIRLIRVQAHEIRNSMAPVASLAESLLKQNQNDQTREGLNIILERTRHLTKFVESYRKLTHTPAPDIKPFKLGDILDRTRVLLSDQPNFSKVHLKIEKTCRDQVVQADKDQLNQVLINLLRNSYEALDHQDQGEISISSDVDSSGMIRISIQDNGPGIEPELLEEIFIPFFTTKTQGTGIGLSLSKQIIRQHGGDLMVSSEIGKGANFQLLLPAF